MNLQYKEYVLETEASDKRDPRHVFRSQINAFHRTEGTLQLLALRKETGP